MKNKEYYLGLEYGIATRELSEEEGGGILAYYTDMPNISGDGESIEEAIKDVKSAFACYLEVALESKEEIKEPSHLDRSKRINITIPVSVLNKIDNYVKDHHTNRSLFFKESALQAMG